MSSRVHSSRLLSAAPISGRGVALGVIASSTVGAVTDAARVPGQEGIGAVVASLLVSAAAWKRVVSYPRAGRPRSVSAPLAHGAAVILITLIVCATTLSVVPLHPEIGAWSFVFVAAAGAVELRLLEPPRRVLVIGNADFQRHIAEVAGQSGRIVVHEVDPGTSTSIGTVSELSGASGGDVDELVVDAAAVVRVGDIPHADRARARRVLFVSAHEEHGAAGRRARRCWSHAFDQPIGPFERCFKRIVDILLGAAALLISVPILAVAAVALRLDSRGPVIFRQTRLGVDGCPFVVFKLRTMHVNSDPGEHQAYVTSLIQGAGRRHGRIYKLSADHRITRVGRVLRRLSVDELPQLVNVVRGDMSLVGPRPPLPRETEIYSPHAWQRLRVKPGITGLWQVSGRCELAFGEMVDLDIRYWQTWSPILELRILLRTPRAVVSGRGAA